jgi:hypothetical protein
MSLSELPKDVLPGRSVVDNSALLEACNIALANAYLYLSEQFVSENEVSGLKVSDLRT